MTGYVYDQAWHEERARIAGMEALWDPGTRRLLTRILDRRPASRVLLVGAGGGSIAEWLVPRAGHVLATDVDVRFLEPLAAPGLEVRRLDVVEDPLPGGAFDLIHTRLVLEHLPGRDDVVRRLAAALVPGGTLVVEDYDWTAFGFDPSDDTDVAAVEGILAFMARAGFDRTYGRRVVSSLAAQGLEVTGEGRQLAIDASHPGFAFFRLSFEQLAPHAVEAGLMDPQVAEITRGHLQEPERRVLTPVLMAAAGRRAETS